MEGIERLEKEVLELNDCSITKIFSYLKSRKDLYEKFNNKGKSIEGMYQYIYEKARKHQHKNMAIIDDNIVYLWAVTYFLKSDEELGIKTKKEEKAIPSSSKKVIEKINEEQNKNKEEDNQITLFEEVQ